MITVDDELFQWDSGHVVKLTGKDADATEVHFAQYCSRAEALVVAVRDDQDDKVADIPNSYLVDNKDLCVWTWADDQTISGKRFRIRARAKPSGYVYTPTEVKNYEHLQQWMLDKLSDMQVALAGDYETLKNKPKINTVELIGDKSFKELGLTPATVEDIDSLFS